MGKAIGIDLGTTNTAVAVLVDGRPRVLEDEKGYKVLPSAVSLRDGGSFHVGHSARGLTITEPKRTLTAVKRLMGRHFDSPEVNEARARMSYDIVEAPDGTASIKIGDQVFRPEEICALVLQVARGIAERALNEPVDEAVITVPAYFNHAQRTATMEAARLAGMRCERLLNEPTAAALAYGFRKNEDRTLLIFDLGGGTFDVSVLHMSSGVYEILASKGDTFLGGEDFDFRVVDYLADHFQTDTGVDLRADPSSLQRLKDAAERAKCELSFSDRTTVLIPRITGTQSLELAISRLTLESLVQDLVDRTLEVTRRSVSEAGLQLSDIDDIILVGGQTRMPRLREAITGLFGRQPSRGVHPEEVVAIGAAVHAHSLVDSSASRPLLLDVTPFDLGIDVAGGLFQPIIARNTHVPCSASRVFATSRDYQEAVQVTVRQGDSRFASENEFLGEVVMQGLTPAPRMETKVEVTFRLDSNGILHCTSVEPATGERTQLTVRNYADFARGGGKVKPELSVSESAGFVMQNAGAARDAEPPVLVPTEARKGPAPTSGLLSRLFGRSKGASPPPPALDVAAAPPAPAPDAAAERSYPVEPDATQVLDANAFSQPSRISMPPTNGGARPLPHEDDSVLPFDDSEDFDGVEELDEGAFGELLEHEGVPAPAVFGLAGEGIGLHEGGLDADSGRSALMLPEEDSIDFADLDAFELPADEDAPEELPLPLDGELDPPFDDEFLQYGAQAGAAAAPESDWGAKPENGLGTSAFDDFLSGLTDGPDPEPSAFERELPAAPPAASRSDGQGRSFSPVEPGEPEELFSLPAPAAPPPAPPVARQRKPARLKLAYRQADAMVAEYRENLRRGGCFVKTAKPLPVGRECRIEVRAPGLDAPLELAGVVTWSSVDQPMLPNGQDPGMGIEYRLNDRDRVEIERRLAQLSG